jgi:competence protein ComEA
MAPWGRQQAQERLQRIQSDWAPVASASPKEPPQLRFGPWRLPAWRGLGALLAAALLLAGWWWWSGRPSEFVAPSQVVAAGIAIADTPLALESSGEVVVHVLGAVRDPGLFTLPPGSRVADAVDAAGGARSDKALASVNLARILVDGEQVVLDATGQTAASGSVESSLVSLNQADAAAFETLPGVGPVIAQRIVAWRTSNGPFRSIDELGEVAGIGEAILTQVRPLVRL